MSGKKGAKARGPQSDPEAPEERDDAVESHVPKNGTATAESEEESSMLPEEPAQVEVKMRGSDRSVRTAARRLAGESPKPPPVVSTPANDVEPPDDPIAELLADGKNMVIVTRQTPRNIRDPRTGEKIVTNLRLPGKYTCPTSIAAIEDQVFNEHWGSTYKCTIHPDISSGENTILGHFQITHPDPKAPPWVEGVTDVEPEEPEDPRDPSSRIPTRGDPTLQETDQLVKLKQDAERRIERARLRKEALQMEQEAKRLEAELENGGRPPAPPPGESDEIRKLREQNATLAAQLAEKKVNDRFDKIEGTLADVAKTLATIAAGGMKSAGTSENDLFLKLLDQSKQSSKDMIEFMKSMQTVGKPAASGDDFDKFLDRMTKLQTITGTAPKSGSGGRLSSLEEKLIDMSFDRLTGGGGGDDEEGSGEPFEDAVKLAIKEFAPIAKTYVDKKMDQESTASGGQSLNQDQIKKIYAEAAQAAAKKVQDDLMTQGLQLAQDPTGKLIAIPLGKGGAKQPTVVPPRNPTSRVVSTTKTAEGVVKRVMVEPADLSKKVNPPGNAATAEAPAPTPTKGEDLPKCGVFPMLGPNGSEIKIPFPARPGDLKYDRRYTVDFILDGIRSEIRQGLPEKAEADEKVESYVIGDAIEYLDDELLEQLDNVDSEQKLDALLSPWGTAEKIAEIKKAGERDVVASYLRKLVRSIQREWQQEKAAGGGK